MFRPLRTPAVPLATPAHFARLAQRAGAAAHQPRLYLFSGVSGYLARAGVDQLAAELGAKVHRIDLSRIVSKYLGETEKNLARSLAMAPPTGSILFFDEADALFGKRSEVKDSHDRYANADVNYLLQRLEQRYAGVTALATRSPTPPQLKPSRIRVITTRWPP